MKTKQESLSHEATIRIGQFEFLNGYPLYYGLERGRGWSCFQMVHGVPTELNRMLLDGQLDISPISSIEYASNSTRLSLFSRLSITADGAVDSIRLITRRPIGELESVALTSQSATSVALLKIILAQKYGLEPEYAPLECDAAAALERHDGVLLIGDDALKEHYLGSWDNSYDLGEEWKELTGLPMVYALWAVTRKFYNLRPDEAYEVQERLLYSIDYCRANWNEVVNAAAEEYPFAPELLRSYFRKLRYDLSDEYRLGLMEFYRRAIEAGILRHTPDLNFI